MALPEGMGASLAKDMGKAGLAPAPDEAAPDAEAPPAEDGDSIEAIIADIDGLVPGLGKLVHELVDRLKAEDEEEDAAEG